MAGLIGGFTVTFQSDTHVHYVWDVRPGQQAEHCGVKGTKIHPELV